MSASAAANFFDGQTSRPHDATVAIREPDALEVEVNGERFHWPLEDGGMQWERSSNTLRITFGEHPRSVVLTRDAAFIRLFVQRMQRAGRRGVYDRTLSMARQGPLLFVLGLLFLAVVGYVWVLPFAAERSALLLPTEVDRQLGQAAAPELLLELWEDTARSAVLQQFGDHLALGDRFELRYHVVNDEQVNAFAMPGGHIVVFTGILDRMDHSGQLAALLAHEATHVEERHSMRMLVRQGASYLFLSLLLGDVNVVVALLAENADKIRNLTYSRALETDADLMGMERMAQAGVDPEGMVQLLELLQREAGDMPGSLSFLSSHPLTEQRIIKARERAPQLTMGNSGQPELDRLFQHLKERSTTPSR